MFDAMRNIEEANLVKVGDSLSRCVHHLSFVADGVTADSLATKAPEGISYCLRDVILELDSIAKAVDLLRDNK